MSRIRMFGDDEPENPSPRTTIVGGQPPQARAELPPVPTGLQRLLRLASVDAGFTRELVARRGEVAAAAGVELTASERAILGAIPAAQLQAMIVGLPPPAEDRRTFLREVASSAVLLLGGAALSSCQRPDHRSMDVEGGAAPEVPPPRPDGPRPPTAGALPQPPPPADDAGLGVKVPPPASQPGLTARPVRPQVTRGIRPDRPQVHTAGIRPEYSRPTRGATADRPGKKDPDDIF